MRVLLTLSLLVASLATSSDRADAQSPLVGAWERFAMKDSTGAVVRDLPPAAFTVFSADGFYSQTAIPTGRAKLDKPLTEYTKEELFSRFNRSELAKANTPASVSTFPLRSRLVS